MDLKLADRAIIVTGASRGVGAATAKLLSSEGARLLLVARSEGDLAEVASRCEGEAVALTLDVTAEDAAERIVGTCIERFGRLDGLVNNAGAARSIPPAELREEDWWDQLNLNVMAPMRLMRAAAPEMAAAGWGRIVNVCSSAARQPSTLNMPYSVAKAAQLSLSRVFANEWARRGVLVNAVNPGVLDTPMWLEDGGVADQLAAARGINRDQVLAEVENEMPIGRLGTDREVASVIAFLCSELSANVAGAAWAIDGGEVPTML